MSTLTESRWPSSFALFGTHEARAVVGSVPASSLILVTEVDCIIATAKGSFHKTIGIERPTTVA
jgi:hypothetical protein